MPAALEWLGKVDDVALQEELILDDGGAIAHDNGARGTKKAGGDDGAQRRNFCGFVVAEVDDAQLPVGATGVRVGELAAESAYASFDSVRVERPRRASR